VVDFFVVGSGDVLLVKGLANSGGELGEGGDVLWVNGGALLVDEEEPVSTPSDVSGDGAVVWDLDGDGCGVSIGGNVFNGDAVVFREACGDDADGGFDAVVAGLDSVEVVKSFYDAYRTMEAGVEVGEVIEEDDSGDAGGVGRRAEAGSDDGVEAAGFVDEGGADPIGIFGKVIASGDGSGGEVEAGDDAAGGLAASVGIDDLHENERLARLRNGLESPCSLFSWPVGPPVAEEVVLLVEVLFLAGGKLVVGLLGP